MRTIKLFSIAFLALNFMLINPFKANMYSFLDGMNNFYTEKNVNSIDEDHYRTMHNNKVKIYELSRNGEKIGHSVWLYRTGKNVKAKYFAYKQDGKSIAERYNEWKTGKKIISYCSGPYTAQDYEKPQGLTIDNGNIVNRNIDTALDALVIVEAVGGVRVADLDKPSSDCINLVSINKSVNPRNSSNEKNIFINWAKQENATVFQTNLMYFKNEKKFGDESERALRRIFVIGYDGSEVVHIIFNINRSVSLTNISEEIYRYLKNERNFRVIGVLNFDTGSYDIFQGFYQNGNEDDKLRGTVNVNSAVNLMVYYYD